MRDGAGRALKGDGTEPDIAELLAALGPLSRMAVFLDFDGTLVDIAETPDAISVPAPLEGVLAGLLDATSGATAIVTGRAVETIQERLPGFSGPVAGGHGADVLLPGGRHHRHPVTGSDALIALIARVEKAAEATPGFLAEVKPTGAVLHYRKVPDAGDEARAIMEALATTYPEFELHPAKMAWELRPHDVGKDIAVERLMSGAPFAGRLPVMVGDDATDEAAMEIALSLGGTAIKVGEGATVAPHRLPDPAAVRALLTRWLSERPA